MYDGSEAVVWCSIEGDQDLKFSSRVMDDMPFAQLNLGLSHDVDYNYIDDIEIDEETMKILTGNLEDNEYNEIKCCKAEVQLP